MKRLRILVGVCVLLGLTLGSAVAKTCQLTGTTCTDATASKSISGTNVPVAAIGGCWNYQDTYQCDTADAIDYCQPVIGLGCGVTNTVCNATGVSGACLNFKNDYVCTDKELSTPLPPNVTLINTSYRITSETIDTSACGGMPVSPNCTQQGVDVCTDSTPSKRINGLDVARSCWSWDRTYQCVDSSMTSDCAPFRTNPQCTEIGSKCTEMMGAICQVVEHTYKCSTGGGGSKVTSSCESSQFCMGAACFDTGYSADSDFGQAVSGMELLRQMGYYLDPSSLTVFNGVSSKCQKKLFGLGNCCNTSGGGGSMSNANIASTAGMKALQAGTEYVKAIGTPYVYDMMFQSDIPWLAERAVDAWSANAWSSTGQVGLYGLTFEIGANGISFVGFDPTSFAISVAIQVVLSMLSCSEDEQKLALKRGQNLCVYAGDKCVSKFLGACVTREQSYCCYNSRLSKLIAQGAGGQLGRPPSSGNCGGFTAEELQRVDFSQIDFSEFIAEIAPTAKTSGPATLRANDKINSYYGH